MPDAEFARSAHQMNPGGMPCTLHLIQGMKEHLNSLTQTIISAALGPGMLESAYEACLAFELLDRRLFVERQKALPLIYRGQTLDCGYRIDLMVEQLVIVEVKSIERFERVHAAPAPVISATLRM